MRHYEITRPIGLNTLCKEVEDVCAHKEMYRQCGFLPENLIIQLDPRSGRTTFVEYLTNRYKDSEVMDFKSIDDYLEVCFDGTLRQLKQVFDEIDSAGVYTNEYSNIISMDVTGIADKMDIMAIARQIEIAEISGQMNITDRDSQTDNIRIAKYIRENLLTEFMKNCRRVCEHACVIFFVHTIPSRNEKFLINKLKTIGNIKLLKAEPYTDENMCDLVIKMIHEFGIGIEEDDAFREMLLDLVSMFDVVSVKDAIIMAKNIARFADFSQSNTVINKDTLRSMMTSWNNKIEGRIVK